MNRLLPIFLLLFSIGTMHSQMPQGDAFLQQAGAVRFDFDADGCDANDVSTAIKLKIKTGSETNYTYSSPFTGNYAGTQGQFTITPQPENAGYFTITPEQATIIIDGTSGRTTDFCISPNGYHPDVDVTVIPHNNAVIGHLSTFTVLVKNTGNQTVSGVADFNFPGSLAACILARPMPQTQTTSALRWDFENLRPMERLTFLVGLQTNTATDAQPVKLDDVLTFTANVTTNTQDETPNDNIFELRQTAVSAADPINKICLEGALVPPTMIGQYLNYVINFANTGTAHVHKVVVNDEIDTTRFEMSSLQVVGMSHPGIPLILNNKFEVYFQDIELAPGAQGFVAFKIKTKGTLAVGSTVSNKAKIYYDFNFPIDTNAANTTFQALSIAQAALPVAKIYPNPASSLATIEANQEIQSIVITDAQGRKITEFKAADAIVTHDMAAYASGIYYIKVFTAGGILTQKLVKQ